MGRRKKEEEKKKMQAVRARVENTVVYMAPTKIKHHPARSRPAPLCPASETKKSEEGRTLLNHAALVVLTLMCSHVNVSPKIESVGTGQAPTHLWRRGIFILHSQTTTHGWQSLPLQDTAQLAESSGLVFTVTMTRLWR